MPHRWSRHRARVPGLAQAGLAARHQIHCCMQLVALHLSPCQLRPGCCADPWRIPCFLTMGLLCQEGVDSHVFPSKSSEPWLWQHRVHPACASGGFGKQGRRSQQLMLGKQKLQAVLHSGYQFPRTLLGVKLGSMISLSLRVRHWLYYRRWTSGSHHTCSAPGIRNMGQSARCRGALGWRKSNGGGGNLQHGGRRACLPWFIEMLSCHRYLDQCDLHHPEENPKGKHNLGWSHSGLWLHPAEVL